LLLQLYDSGKLLVFAEQNNGYLWQNFLKVLYRHRNQASLQGLNKVEALNTLAADGRPQFIHSATYEELIEAFGLAPAALAHFIQDRVGKADR
jgi:transketolase